MTTRSISMLYTDEDLCEEMRLAQEKTKELDAKFDDLGKEQNKVLAEVMALLVQQNPFEAGSEDWKAREEKVASLWQKVRGFEKEQGKIMERLGDPSDTIDWVQREQKRRARVRAAAAEAARASAAAVAEGSAAAEGPK